jgi:hypothetical protein
VVADENRPQKSGKDTDPAWLAQASGRIEAFFQAHSIKPADPCPLTVHDVKTQPKG